MGNIDQIPKAHSSFVPHIHSKCFSSQTSLLWAKVFHKTTAPITESGKRKLVYKNWLPFSSHPPYNVERKRFQERKLFALLHIKSNTTAPVAEKGQTKEKFPSGTVCFFLLSFVLAEQRDREKKISKEYSKLFA